MEARISILNVRTVYISEIIVFTCVSTRCHDPEGQNMDMKYGCNSTKRSYRYKLSSLTQLHRCKCYIVRDTVSMSLFAAIFKSLETRNT